MQKLIFQLIVFCSINSFSQTVVHRKYLADNGVEYKAGSTLNYNEKDYRIRKIYSDKKTGVFYFRLKDKSMEDIDINKAISECDVNPCEIDVIAANDCDFNKNELDEFTKKKIVSLNPKRLYRNSSLYSDAIYVRVASVESTLFLTFDIHRSDIFTVGKGNRIMLMFDDQEVVTLENYKTKIADNVKVFYSSFYVWYASFEMILTKEIIDQIYNKPLKKIRYYTNDGYVDKEIKDKYKFEITKAINCVINE